MLPPLPRCSSWAYSSLISPSRVSLPRKGRRVGLHIDIFEACSAFTRVAACTLAQSPIVTANRRLQPFRHLHDCSDCFRLERIAGWASHPLESAAFSRRAPVHGHCCKKSNIVRRRAARGVRLPRAWFIAARTTWRSRSVSSFLSPSACSASAAGRRSTGQIAAREDPLFRPTSPGPRP